MVSYLSIKFCFSQESLKNSTVQHDVIVLKCQGGVVVYCTFSSLLISGFSGKSDGQTKVIREGDNGVAYAWNMREQKWDKVLLIPNLCLFNYCLFSFCSCFVKIIFLWMLFPLHNFIMISGLFPFLTMAQWCCLSLIKSKT